MTREQTGTEDEKPSADLRVTVRSTGGYGYNLSALTALMPVGESFRDAVFRQRSPERVARRSRRNVAQVRLNGIYLAEHARLLASAEPILRGVLEMHGPHVNQSYTAYPAECWGCDIGGYEGEPPDFPCATYRRFAPLVPV